NFQGRVAQQLRAKTDTGSSLEDVIKKYGEGTDEGKAFNNYATAKFDLEVRAKGKKDALMPEFSTEQLKKFVKDYEKNNPDAVTDALTVKKFNDMIVDELVEANVLSKDAGQHIKNSYKNAVPLSRVVPDDLSRA